MEQRKTGRWWLRLAAAGVLLTGAAGFVACSSDDDDEAGDTTPAATQAATQAVTPAVTADEKAVQQVMLDAFEKWNADDLDGFVAFFTDEGLISSFSEGGTLADAKANLANFLGTSEIGNPTFLDTSVEGDAATMDNTFSLGPVLLHSKSGSSRLARNGS